MLVEVKVYLRLDSFEEEKGTQNGSLGNAMY